MRKASFTSIMIIMVFFIFCFSSVYAEETCEHDYKATEYSVKNQSYHIVTFTCSKCGDIQTDERLHAYASSDTVYKYKDGASHYAIRTCYRCGYVNSNGFESHSWNNEYECVDKSSHRQIQTCEKCNTTKKSIVDHIYRPISYENYDNTSHNVQCQCSYCGEIDTIKEQHDWDRTSYEYSFISNEYHNRTFKCKNCDAIKIEKESHDWFPQNKYDKGNNDYHYLLYNCLKCNGTKEEARRHSWNSEDKFDKKDDNYHYRLERCSICDKTKTEMEAHSWDGYWIIEKGSNCENNGTEYTSCVYCGQKKYLTIPKLGHFWSTWEIVNNATVFNDGIKQRTCSICQKNQNISIPKLLPLIKLNAKKISIYVGNTKKLKVTKAYGDKVTKFKSSKPSVATVNSSGKIKAKKAGKATITVKLKSGKKATCRVTVKKKKKSSKKSSSSSGDDGTVYWVSSGVVYHSTRDCPTLSRSRNIHSGSNPPSGRRKCKVCY